jgi:hypothetical protein
MVSTVAEAAVGPGMGLDEKKEKLLAEATGETLELLKEKRPDYRKVGTGLHLIGSRTPDPARETGRTYRVALGKWGNTVFCLVDGGLQHSYYDAGTFGPPLAGGSVGFRHWGGADATYTNVKAYRLKEDRPAGK